MGTGTARAMRTDAESASAWLAQQSGVTGVALFGSVARGDATPLSDIDLIVLGDSSALTSARIRRDLGVHLGREVSAKYYTADVLDDYLDKWSRFAAHLRSEASILFDRDGELTRIISEDRPLSVEHELIVQEKHLALYEHSERFGGRFMLPLAHMFRIGRAALFAAMAQQGELEFSRSRVFDRARVVLPELEHEIDRIEEAEAFYEAVRTDDAAMALPFDPYGPSAEGEFEKVRSSIAAVIEVGRRA